MSKLVETRFDSAYTISRIVSYESVEAFALYCAKFQQSTSAQLRLWVNPSADPESPESRNIAGDALDTGLYPVMHKLCEIRVSKSGMAIAEAFTSLQSIVRNAFPVLKGKGGGVSVRYLEVKPDSSGDFGKTSISNTKAFAGAKHAEWSRVGEDGILRIARIAWKQAVTADILDEIVNVIACPGGNNIGIVADVGNNDAILPQQYHDEPNGHREPGYTQAYVEEIVMKTVQKDRKVRRVRLEERDLLAMIHNCHGEMELSIRAAAMTRFGLVEPIVVPFHAPLPNRKRIGHVLPDDVTA